MPLATDIRAQMMGAIGETDYSSLDAWMQAKLLNDLNAVCELIYGKSPAQAWQEDPAGDTVLAPVTLSSITVTNASKALSGAGLTARMHGATVQCSGQSTQNRIFQTGASTWNFLFPHLGSSVSNATLTVYHDCLNLTDTVLRVIRPVIIANVWELLPADGPAQMQMPGWAMYPTHNPRPTSSYPVSGWDRQVATPTQYLVETTQLYGGSYVPMIRLNPLPDAQYNLHWQQRNKFTKLVDWNDARTVLIPHQFEESCLIPLLLEKLMHLPAFEGDKEVVAEQAANARAMLESLSDVQEQRDVVLDVSGGW